jgi:hypothetical protein
MKRALWALIFVLIAGLADPALAGSGYGIETETTAMPAGGSKAAVAECPPGSKVVGGGFEVEGDENTVTAAFPSSEQRFTVRATNGALVADSEVKAYAVCDGDIQVKTVVEEGEGDSGERSIVKAKCPQGMTLTGGGVKVEDASERILQNSPGGDDTRVWVAKSFAKGGTSSPTAYAQCDRAGGEYEAGFKGTGFETSSRLEKRCSGGLAPTSGGFRFRRPGTASAKRSIPAADKWTLRVNRVSEGDRDFRLYVICGVG